MPTPDNTVSVLIAGKTHSKWTSYEIDNDLLTPADAFSVVLGQPKGIIPPEVAPGAKCEVRVGTDTVMIGALDDRNRKIGKGVRSLNLTGRDAAGQLLDCSAPIFNAQNLSLEAIVNKLVKPLGITKVRIDAEKAATTNKVQIEPGIKVWDALLQYCEANGLWPWFEPDGTLVVGGPDYSAPPVATLILRESGEGTNVQEMTIKESMKERYSEVTVLGQNHSGASKIKATAKDAGVTLHRPLIVVDGDVASQADALKKARKILSDSRLKGFTIEALVKGHRMDDGTLWTPGQRIHVINDVDGIDAIYFLMSRALLGGRTQGQQTKLILKEDGAWVLDANPKRAKTKSDRRSKKSNKKGKKDVYEEIE